MKREKQITSRLTFLSEGATPFHAVAACEKRLTDAGFSPLSEGEDWKLEAGKGYYVTRNRSSILAFRVPKGEIRGFMIAASHTDSPTFRVKREVVILDSRDGRDDDNVRDRDGCLPVEVAGLIDNAVPGDLFIRKNLAVEAV